MTCSIIHGERKKPGQLVGKYLWGTINATTYRQEDNS